MVLIGVSTGGPAALAKLLPAIPRDIGVPILIVQHMPPIFTKSLADSLATKCAVASGKPCDGEIPEPNTVYIAPGGRQMRLGAGADNRPVLEMTDDPPENNCRPAVDYLFRSAANRFPGRTMAVILTGMGSDGTLGLRLLKRQGCFVIAQDEASCVVYGMPKAAVDAGVTDVILPLNSIAGRIAAAVRGRPGLTRCDHSRRNACMVPLYPRDLRDSSGRVQGISGGDAPEQPAFRIRRLQLLRAVLQGASRRNDQTARQESLKPSPPTRPRFFAIRLPSICFATN